MNVFPFLFPIERNGESVGVKQGFTPHDSGIPVTRRYVPKGSPLQRSFLYKGVGPAHGDIGGSSLFLRGRTEGSEGHYLSRGAGGWTLDRLRRPRDLKEVINHETHKRERIYR